MYLFCHSVKNVLLVDICLKGAIKMGESGASLVVQWLRIACQCRGHEFEPWSRKIPYAAGQLSPCTTTTEPVL